MLTRLIRRIWELFLDLLDLLFPGDLDPAAAPWVPWLFAAIGFAVLGWIGYRLVRGRQGSGSGARVGGSRAEPMREADWVEWAAGREAEGRFREAATGYYQAALLHLDRRGVLRFAEWKTPGDYLDEFAHREANATGFAPLVAEFVSIAFGVREPAGEAVRRLEGHYQALRASG